jgi:hypothetical protein
MLQPVNIFAVLACSRSEATSAFSKAMNKTHAMFSFSVSSSDKNSQSLFNASNIIIQLFKHPFLLVESY